VFNTALLLLLGVFTWFDNAANRGITYQPDPTSTPVTWAAGPRVGVNVYNLHMEPDPAAVTRTLRLAREMGARYVRMQVPWEDIEIHGWGDFIDRRNLETTGAISSWAKYDRIVDLATTLGLELVVRLDRPPDWARRRARIQPEFKAGLERDGNSTGPPDNYSDYSAFVSTVVSRYRGKVRFFQLWNEPNLKNEWNWQEPNPEEFTRLLQFGSTAARAANPDVVIVFPPLAPVDGLDKRAPMTELEYLDRVYRAGGKEYFDIMSAQSYGLGQPPDEHRYIRLRPLNNWSWTRPVDTRADVSRLVLLREVMERHGDGNKAVWVSEFGWNSAPDSIPEDRRFTWGEPVSEQQKARYLVEHIERARDEWPWAGVMFVWVLRYGGYQEPDPADPTPYFALVSRDWEKLPAYHHLQDYLAQPAVAGVGVHPWEHPAVEEISGGWRLRFSGERVTLVGGLAGTLEQVTLDGQPTTLERGGLSTGEETHSAGKRSFITLTTTPSTHTLEIIAPGAEPPSRFVVFRARLLPWFWSLAPAALIGIFLLSSAATVRALYDLFTPS
jgi:hypothetical protein